MTSLSRLSIQGVRSYGADDPEVIDFQKPLTIIVGSNGSGKTTIIEALKFITTGSMPPLSDGGKTWIRDPKLEGSSSTRAQVRLAFRTRNDAKAVMAVRTVQLTQSKSTRTFKALESILKVKDLSTGTENSISHRCADMDKLTPQLMGVSASILENVIFCHQSESDWPLSDSKTLKLKFDDIFSATRYTKALEQITKLKKEKASAVKLGEANLKTIEANLKHYQRIKADLMSAQTKIDKLQTEAREIEDRTRSVEDELRDLDKKRQEMNTILATIEAKETLCRRAETERDESFSRMNHQLEGDDSALERTRQEMIARKAKYNSNMEQARQRLDQYTRECESREADYERLQRQSGAYDQKVLEAKRKKDELRAMRSKLCSELNLTESEVQSQIRAATASLSAQSQFMPPSISQSMEIDSPVDDDTAFLNVIDKILARHTKELNEHKIQAARIDQGFESQIINAKQTVSELKQQGSHLLLAAKDRVAKLKDLGSACHLIEGKLNSGDVEDVEAQLLTLESSGSDERDMNDADISAQLSSKQRELNALQVQLNGLNAEKQKLGFQNEQATVIKVKLQDCDEQRRKHNDLLSHLQRGVEDFNSGHSHDDSLAASSDPVPMSILDEMEAPQLELHFSVNPLPHNITANQLSDPQYDSRQFTSAISSFRTSFKSWLAGIAREQSEASSAVGKLAGQMRATQDQLSKTNTQLERIKRMRVSSQPVEGGVRVSYEASELITQFNGKDVAQYDQQVLDLQESVNKRDSEQGNMDATIQVYEKQLDTSREQHCCALCDRGFDSDAELQSLVNKLESMLSDWRNKDARDASLEADRLKLAKLKHFQQTFRDYDRLTREKVLTQSRVDAIRTETSAAESRERKASERLRGAQKRERILQDELSATADQLSAAWLHFSESLLSIERERKKLSSGRDINARDFETVSAIVDEKEKARAELMSVINRLQEQREKSIKLRESRMTEIHALRTKAADFARLREARTANRSEQSTLRTEHISALSQNTELTAKQAQAEAQCAELEKDRQKSRGEAEVTERQLSQNVSSLQRERDAFVRALDACRTYEREVQQSQVTRQHMIDTERSIKASVAKRVEATDKFNSLKDDMTRFEVDLADVMANIDYRRRVREVDLLKSEITAMRSSTQLDDGLVQRLRQSNDLLRSERDRRAELKGQLAQLQETAKQKLAESKSSQYRGIDDEYTEKLIGLQADSMCVADLELYSKCLDVSLMEYHKLKMREINELLRDYWRSVYKGKDIDEIYIHSSCEEEGRRRQYTYSVMMKQGDTSLEMRGRCSAGQRVLASLLIRLALADTFCLSCGVLALDEPTTNLDQRNIRAFAGALHDIVEKRREQSNFQLIVITHDEQFVDELGRSCAAEEYYRVWKDDKQRSRIKKNTMKNHELTGK